MRTPIENDAALCRHCSDPCGSSPVRDGEHVFCCRGCAAVFNLLHAAGLEGFYACETPPGVSQRKTEIRQPLRFAALDDPSVAATLIEFDDGRRASATFHVPDLHCASCLWLLERLWRLHAGIARVDADLVRRTVHVWFDPRLISLRGVAEQLAAAGYEPDLSLEPQQPQRGSAARRGLYLRLAVAGFAFGNIMLFSIPRYANGAPLDGGFQRLFDTLNVLFALPVLVFSASGYFASAWRAVRLRRVTLDVPIALGLAAMFLRSVADIGMGRGEGYLDSFTGLVFFLLIGRLLQQKAFDRIAFDRSFRSFLPLSVLVDGDAGPVATPLERVRAGDRIVIRPHEIVPADARLLDDEGAVDYAFVTGESAPVSVREGDLVRAGGRASRRSLRLSVTQPVSHSRLAALWNNPAFAKVKRRWLADVTDRFGAIFTATATGLAALGAIAWWPDASMAMQVATAVLIIACPCAITLAAPITLGTAMEILGRRGFYLKHGAVALDLGRTNTITFDKTGTLTTAAGGMTAEPQGLTDEDWALARRLAAESAHPVSRAIAGAGRASGAVMACVEVPGRGIRGIVDGHVVAIGTPAFAAAGQEPASPESIDGTAIAIDGRLRGWVRLHAPARPGMREAIGELAATHRMSLISGDRIEEAGRWRPVFDDRMAFAQSPEDKLAAIAALQAEGRRVLMVGDGLNDAGALAAADVGLAVSDDTACIVPACDAVIRGDRLPQLPAFLRFTRRARQIVIACFVVSMAYNAVGLTLALSGLLTPLATAILMPVSSLTILALGAGGMRWYARELPAEPAGASVFPARVALPAEAA